MEDMGRGIECFDNCAACLVSSHCKPGIALAEVPWFYQLLYLVSRRAQL